MKEDHEIIIISTKFLNKLVEFQTKCPMVRFQLIFGDARGEELYCVYRVYARENIINFFSSKVLSEAEEKTFITYIYDNKEISSIRIDNVRIGMEIHIMNQWKKVMGATFDSGTKYYWIRFTNDVPYKFIAENLVDVRF